MILRFAITAVALAALAACGDKPQTANAAAKKADTQAWQGADNPFVAPGWKAGDKASWEEQMRARARGQNEYTRVAATAAH